MKNEAFLTEKLNRMKLYENELYSQGFRYIVGADEVGRGPLAGPVVAAALVLPVDFSVLGVDDSKKLSEKKRGELFEVILERSLAYGIGIVDNLIIDEINIPEATKMAMRTAITEAGQSLVRAVGSPPDYAIIDAMTLEGIGMPQEGIVKGDEKSVSIAAASIIAKVTRDKMMCEFHEKYPYYGFDQNKGYGTKAHYEGILKYGTCEIHRKTFLKKLNAAQDRR